MVVSNPAAESRLYRTYIYYIPIWSGLVISQLPAMIGRDGQARVFNSKCIIWFVREHYTGAMDARVSGKEESYIATINMISRCVVDVIKASTPYNIMYITVGRHDDNIVPLGDHRVKSPISGNLRDL